MDRCPLRSGAGWPESEPKQNDSLRWPVRNSSPYAIPSHATMNHICRSAPTVIKTSPHQKGHFRFRTSAAAIMSVLSVFRSRRRSSLIPGRTRSPKARHHVPATIRTIERISKTCMRTIVCHRGQGLANQGSADPAPASEQGRAAMKTQNCTAAESSQPR